MAQLTSDLAASRRQVRELEATLAAREDALRRLRAAAQLQAHGATMGAGAPAAGRAAADAAGDDAAADDGSGLVRSSPFICGVGFLFCVIFCGTPAAGREAAEAAGRR